MKTIQKITAVLTTLVSIAVCSASVMPGSAANTNSALTSETTNFYNAWKTKYLVQNPYTSDAQYYVWYNEDEPELGNAVTVSEAHGYGMLIMASMADYDSQAKDVFDGMYRYYRAHLSEIGPNLMAWQQQDNGSAIVNVSGADSATDGDMDIAYALLMADSIWGSEGEINYKQAAISVINDIMTYEVNKTDWILQLGDWAYWSKEGDQYYAATRPSDFIVQYLPVFAEVTDDDRWMNVYNSTYNIITNFTQEYQTGILPDFVIKDNTGKFVPAPANYLEGEHDGEYSYNSCRTPWRIGMDYLINGNEDALAFAKSMNTFITHSTGNDPWEIKAGYTLDGKAFEDYDDLCFTAPFLITAACGDNTEWHDELREVILDYGDDVYFGDTIKMLCLIVDDGGWIVPQAGETHPIETTEPTETTPEVTTEPLAVLGDVNADGTFDLTDIVMMQKYLLRAGGLTDWKAGDLHEDGVIDVFDLAKMKRLYLTK